MIHANAAQKLELPSSPGAVVLENLSDDLLMARIVEDDAVAYRVLVERHADRLFSVAFRILRNRADAEDVAQDALVKVWLKREKWRPGTARLSTWLYRVVVNPLYRPEAQARAGGARRL